jgi:hypothetical protein
MHIVSEEIGSLVGCAAFQQERTNLHIVYVCFAVCSTPLSQAKAGLSELNVPVRGGWSQAG